MGIYRYWCVINFIYFKFILIIWITPSLYAKEIIINPGPNVYDEIQEAMILMDEGDTLTLKSGNYWFEVVFLSMLRM